MNLKFLSLAVLALVFVGFSAFSPPPVFMKLGDIKGEVTAEGHEKWIDLQSCQLDGGKMSVHKLMDKSSPMLARAAEAGRKFPQAIIDASNADGNQTLRIVLQDVLVSSYSVSKSGSDQVQTESFSLNFTSARFVCTVDGKRKNLNQEEAQALLSEMKP